MAISAVAEGTMKMRTIEVVAKHSVGKKPIPDRPRAAKLVTSVLKSSLGEAGDRNRSEITNILRARTVSNFGRQCTLAHSGCSVNSS